MQAIIDGDILAYRIAFWADTEGLDVVEDRIKTDLEAWTPKECTKVMVAFSCPREVNFRRSFWPLYKKHREDKKSPDCMKYVIESMYDICSSTSLDTHCIDKLEADDIIGMLVSRDEKTIGVTIDKDLRQIPGYHWNPDKEPEPVFIDKGTANRNFYLQWMMGDSTDNIWGLWKFGPKKAMKVVDSIPESDICSTILALYENEDWSKRPETKKPSMSKAEFALAQARCVRILRFGDYDKKTKTVNLWTP